jgi:1,4-dihydroxy-2-naphthoyl-CoA hydrolase
MSKTIWSRDNFTPEDVNSHITEKSILNFLDIRFTEIGDDYVKARMPVNERTHQIYGILHGGATCVLTESVGSIASILCIDQDKKTVVGSVITANHLRPVKDGYVECVCRPVHIGRTKHVWDMQVFDDQGKLVAKSELTCAIIDNAQTSINAKKAPKP